MKFSETLIDLRKEKNLSQQQLANATGLSRSAIAKSEKGRSHSVHFIAPFAFFQTLRR